MVVTLAAILEDGAVAAAFWAACAPHPTDTAGMGRFVDAVLGAFPHQTPVGVTWLHARYLDLSEEPGSARAALEAVVTPDCDHEPALVDLAAFAADAGDAATAHRLLLMAPPASAEDGGGNVTDSPRRSGERRPRRRGELRPESRGAAGADRGGDPRAELVEDDARTFARALAEHDPAHAPASLDPNDPEIREVMAQIIARYEEQWLDESIPALGGRTPRQAAANPIGREELEQLLASFPSAGPDNAAMMSPDRLRQALGL